MGYFDRIKDHLLFEGIEAEEFEKMLQCLAAFKKNYNKNEFIIRTGDTVQYIGIILKGSVHVFHEDFWGNRTILANIGVGGMFCEAFVCGEQEFMPVSVLAQIDTEILMLDYGKIIRGEFGSCNFQQKLIKNMLKIMAEKNIFLTQKIEQISKRTTKEKVMSYLSYESIRRKKEAFDISLDRQELADYLAVDRSALSRVLSELKREGVINFKKNYFTLYRK